MKLGKILRFIGKTFLVLVLVYGLTSVARIFFGGRIASASTSTFYPQFCLGGWHQPSLSAGDAALAGGEEIGGGNSAFLESSVAAQLFCGYFNLEPRELPPTSVKLTFLWDMKFKNMDNAPQATPVEPSPSGDSTESFSSSEGFLVSPATGIIAPSPSAPPTEASQAGPPEAPATANPPAETPKEKADNTPPPSPPSPEAPPEPQTKKEEAQSPPPSPVEPEASPSPPPPAQLESTPPPPAPEPTSSSESEGGLGGLGLKVAGYVLEQALGIKTARAQETALPNEIKNYALDFLEVSYSLNGIRWYTLGRVGRHNWKNFSVSVPVNSWEELRNLQVTITPVPSLETKPDIYLNGIELQVEGERTASEVASDGVENLSKAAQETLNALDSARDLALAQTLSAVSKEIYYYSEGGEVKAAPQPPPPRLEKRLRYKISGEALPAERALPWHPEETKQKIAKMPWQLTPPNIQIEDNGFSLKISGPCSAPYFVILTYRDPEKYLKKPGGFASNYAGPCVAGRFDYPLTHLPSDTPPGKYYLLLAEQEEDGPWVPSSSIVPIEISSEEVKIGI